MRRKAEKIKLAACEGDWICRQTLTPLVLIGLTLLHPSRDKTQPHSCITYVIAL
ncbi:hypothetical protein thalar_01451 [Litoreibacter arenae DSM 19593]|uniref:Uncharacterized protein n=1 Tax=Litoreibacter arenae DSM 19593 TaxID=1123360 RepID=S9QKM6_9RHOB|nr:hypothetical protein thalar_01451 [Litoreibacter arenae DSM 19593]